MSQRGNVLFIVIDQLRADVLDGALAAHVATPNLDRFAATAARFRRHFSVTAPCGPSRASFLTGLYAMNHGAVRNGTPLAAQHTNLALEARKAGYEPLLFGYTDIQPDPTTRHGNDPDLGTYEGVLPGFRELVEMRLDNGQEWPSYLRELGYEVPRRGEDMLGLYQPNDDGSARYRAEHSDTAYLTDRTVAALDQRAGSGWFAHVTYTRPHPPLVAPAPYHTLIDPAAVPPADRRAPEHAIVAATFSGTACLDLFWGFDGDVGAIDDAAARVLRATYLGLVAEVDHQMGRLLDWLESSGEAEHTLVVISADHGDMLGDKGMWGKQTVFDPAFHVPLLIGAPGMAGRSHDALTESVDLAPTILDWLGQSVPPGMNGRSLLPLMRGGASSEQRRHVYMEVELGDPDATTRFETFFNLPPEQCRAAMLREDRWKYVHFGGGVAPLLFDLHEDPGESINLATDPTMSETLSRLRAAMLDHRMEHAHRPF